MSAADTIEKPEGAEFWQARVRDLAGKLDQASARKAAYEAERDRLIAKLAAGDGGAASALASLQRPDPTEADALRLAMAEAERHLKEARAAEAVDYRLAAREEAKALIEARIAAARDFDLAAKALEEAHEKYVALGLEIQANNEVMSRFQPSLVGVSEQVFGKNRPIFALPIFAKSWANSNPFLSSSPHELLERGERSVWANHLAALGH